VYHSRKEVEVDLTEVFLLSIYDKSDHSNISNKDLNHLVLSILEEIETKNEIEITDIDAAAEEE